MCLRILNAQIESQFSRLFSQLCIYYYADGVPDAVHEIQDEDGLVYTKRNNQEQKG